MSKAPDHDKPVAKKAAVKKRGAKPVVAKPAAAKKPARKKPAAPKVDAPQLIRITQIGSSHGRKPGQQATLIGLGLNKIHKSRELAATPETMGMVKKVAHLLRVEELAAGQKTHETE